MATDITASEVFSIIHALESRMEWIEDIDDHTGCEHELPHIKSALKKFSELKFRLEVLDDEN